MRSQVRKSLEWDDGYTRKKGVRNSFFKNFRWRNDPSCSQDSFNLGFVQTPERDEIM
jgi:hypothetical protein